MRRAILWLAMLPLLPSHGQEPDLQEIAAGLAARTDALDVVTLSSDGKPVQFDIKLGESAVEIGDGTFDGILLRCPSIPAGADFIWYFNAPMGWGNWYIVPVEGTPDPAFRTWFDGDKLYDPFDRPGESGRLRILQTLYGSYFTAGKDYILWFRKAGGEGGESLRGTAGFAVPERVWDHDSAEKALGLSALPPETQVEALGSRGGKILLDPGFFEPAYAAGRIDAVFYSMRHAGRRQGGYYIPVQSPVPASGTQPLLADLRAKFGEPDFIRSGTELAAVRDRTGTGEVGAEERASTLHHYDHFAFEVETGASEPRVLRVSASASDFSAVKPPASGASFAAIKLENLTVFHKDGKEVGRAYFFREGDREPLFFPEPPPGEYRADHERLTYEGDGSWVWETFHPDGKPERRLPMQAHRLSGQAEGFHENGRTSFTAGYRDGVLEGEMIHYDESGAESSRSAFKHGATVD